jgi:hypothetical protein
MRIAYAHRSAMQPVSAGARTASIVSGRNRPYGELCHRISHRPKAVGVGTGVRQFAGIAHPDEVGPQLQSPALWITSLFARNCSTTTWKVSAPVRKQRISSSVSAGSAGPHRRSRSGQIYYKTLNDALAFNGNSNAGIPPTKDWALIGAADVICISDRICPAAPTGPSPPTDPTTASLASIASAAHAAFQKSDADIESPLV